MSALQAIRVEGGIFPSSMFQRLTAGEIGTAESRTGSSYGLAGSETLRDAANRSWTYLVGAWRDWRKTQAAALGAMTSTNAATARDKWLLILLRELGYGRVPTTGPGGIHVDGDEDGYPVSHLWQHVPIHLLGPGVDLDRRNPGVAGATRAPQAMVQELLNRSDDYLWAIVSNGRRLRLLRDSTALAGSAFVEFDLEAIFDGELFSEFLLLWQTCHASRLDLLPVNDGDPTPVDCWLELWRADAVRAGSRALDKLRGGVENALIHLGTGFLAHPDNRELTEALLTRKLTREAYHRHLLRLVYRLLFLFVTEDRGLLLDPSAPAEAATRYRDYLSTQRLRRQARARHGSPAYADLWRGQRLVLNALGGDGEPSLALPALGGIFDAEDGQGEPLLTAELSNEALLEAVRDLAWMVDGRSRVQQVDYRNLGAEELGGVYESLLELVPQVSVDEHRFTLDRLSGNERKTTGSYYTPPALVSALLDSALDPVIDDAVRGTKTAEEAERKLLALTVCDPACGSGHFLVAAARRIARRLAAVRSGEEEPTPDAVRHALRDVIGRCVYGVDINPMAAELAKVSLWLEAMEPGKALGFLDARIRVGNSLLGATPSLLKNGIPDDAFKTLEGDDKKYASLVKKRNKIERGAFGSVQDQLDLDFGGGAIHDLATARQQFHEVHDDAAAVRKQARMWRTYAQSEDYRNRKVPADAWSAAFVWPLRPSTITRADSEREAIAEPPTSDTVRRFEKDPDAVALLATRTQVETVAAEYKFFHWHLEFPEIFDRPGGRTGEQGWTGGFDAMLGNPPWERVKLQEQEFFAGRDDDIATAPNAAARTRLITALANSDSEADRVLHREYTAALRRANGESKLMRTSGSYPLAGRGDVNTYAVFTELFRTLTGPTGQAGIIVPTGIATDATTQHFFRDLVETKSIAALYDFENGTPKIFDGVDTRQKFCLLTMTGRDRDADAASFAFFLHDAGDIEARQFALTPEEITLLNPNTGTLPIFRTRRDAELNVKLSRGRAVVWSDKAESIKQRTTRFSVLSDLGKAEAIGAMRRTDGGTSWCRVYEGKMFHRYNQRFASYDDGDDERLVAVNLDDPGQVVRPRTWLRRDLVADHYGPGWEGWVVAYRDIGRNSDARTMIACVLPEVAADYTVRHLVGQWELQPLILANYNSLVFDFIIRSRNNGTHLSDYLVYQAPVVVDDEIHRAARWDSSLTIRDWMIPRIVELTFTSWELAEFARMHGDNMAPFVWDRERRALIDAELDAAFAHLYGVSRGEFNEVLESFVGLRDTEVKIYGEFRTMRVTMEVFDAMQRAIDQGTEYQTILDPPPGHGPRHDSEGGRESA